MKQTPDVALIEADRRMAEIKRLNAALAVAIAKKKRAEKRVFNTPAKDEE